MSQVPASSWLVWDFKWVFSFEWNLNNFPSKEQLCVLDFFTYFFVYINVILVLRGCQQNVLGQFSRFSLLIFYLVSPPLLPNHTKGQKTRYKLNCYFHTNNTFLLYVIVELCNQKYNYRFGFLPISKNRLSISGKWMSFKNWFCVNVSCKTWLTPQYDSILKFDTILIWTKSFCMQKIMIK